jgi:predicted dehydrogenase
MKRITRRTFMKGTLAASAAITLPKMANAAIRGANEDIRLAVVGVGGKGSAHCKVFSRLKGVRLVAVCDANQDHIDRRVNDFKKQGMDIKGYLDVRKLLESKEIDAIVSATPNHWHSLVTIWACQAGKDVYIEKPVSHNVWEGRKMIEAARKYKRIVQTGTQSRSDGGLAEAFNYMQDGKLGKIKVARGFCYKPRSSIGLVKGPQPISPSLDYNLWCGPAALTPLRRKRLRYDWHWDFETGNGDVGNQGIHEMDMCRWALGQPGLAPRIFSYGGRLGYKDDGDTPNTLVTYLDYKPAPLIFETRGLPIKKGGGRNMDNYRGTRVGICIICEGGYFVGGSGGGWVYDNNGKKIKQFKGSGGEGHHANFIRAVRSRKVSDLKADIVEGHISSALCHMGNISYQIGNQASPDEIKAVSQGDPELGDSYDRFMKHMAANEVDLNATPAILGPMLTMDSNTEKFTGEHSFNANMYLKRNYRREFEVPEKV